MEKQLNEMREIIKLEQKLKSKEEELKNMDEKLTKFRGRVKSNQVEKTKRYRAKQLAQEEGKVASVKKDIDRLDEEIKNRTQNVYVELINKTQGILESYWDEEDKEESIKKIEQELRVRKFEAEKKSRIANLEKEIKIRNQKREKEERIHDLESQIAKKKQNKEKKSGSVIPKNEDFIKETEETIKHLEKEIEVASKMLIDNPSQGKLYSSKINKMAKQISENKALIETKRSQIQKEKSQILTLEKQVATLEKKLQEAEAQVIEQNDGEKYLYLTDAALEDELKLAMDEVSAEEHITEFENLDETQLETELQKVQSVKIIDDENVDFIEEVGSLNMKLKSSTAKQNIISSLEKILGQMKENAEPKETFQETIEVQDVVPEEVEVLAPEEVIVEEPQAVAEVEEVKIKEYKKLLTIPWFIVNEKEKQEIIGDIVKSGRVDDEDFESIIETIKNEYGYEISQKELEDAIFELKLQEVAQRALEEDFIESEELVLEPIDYLDGDDQEGEIVFNPETGRIIILEEQVLSEKQENEMYENIVARMPVEMRALVEDLQYISEDSFDEKFGELEDTRKEAIDKIRETVGGEIDYRELMIKLSKAKWRVERLEKVDCDYITDEEYPTIAKEAYDKWSEELKDILEDERLKYTIDSGYIYRKMDYDKFENLIKIITEIEKNNKLKGISVFFFLNAVKTLKVKQEEEIKVGESLEERMAGFNLEGLEDGAPEESKKVVVEVVHEDSETNEQEIDEQEIDEPQKEKKEKIKSEGFFSKATDTIKGALSAISANKLGQKIANMFRKLWSGWKKITNKILNFLKIKEDDELDDDIEYIDFEKEDKQRARKAKRAEFKRNVRMRSKKFADKIIDMLGDPEYLSEKEYKELEDKLGIYKYDNPGNKVETGAKKGILGKKKDKRKDRIRED